jgi:hypothetical protein
MSNINHRTEFLSQDQQQLDNSAMMPASSIRPIRGQDHQKPTKEEQKTEEKQKQKQKARK